MYINRLVQSISIVLVLLFLIACGGAEERSAKHIKKANDFLAAKNYAKAKIEVKNAIQIQPKNAKARLLLATIESKSGRIRAALAQYKAVLSLDKKNVVAKAQIARIYVLAFSSNKSKKLLEEAKKLVQEILAVNKSHTLALAIRARINIFSDDINSAEKNVGLAIQSDPENYFAVETKVIILVRQKKIAEVIKFLEAAIKKQADSVAYSGLLIRVYLQQKNTNAAINMLKRLVEKFPNKPAYYADLIRLYLLTKQKDKANEVYRRLVKIEDTNSELKSKYVNFLIKLYGKEIALKQLNEFLSQDAKNSELLLQKAVFLATLKKYKDATVIFEALISDNTSNPIGVKARIGYAKLLLSQNKLKEAKKLIAKVLDKNKNESEAQFLKAHLSMRDGDYNTAISNYQSILGRAPNSARIRKYLAVAFSLNKNDALAKETLRKVLKKNPKDLQAVTLLARLYIKDKNYDSAKEQFEAVLKLSPKHYIALRSLFEIQARNKDIEAATRTANKLIAYYPKSGIGEYFYGLILQSQKKTSEALQQFEIAHNKEPKSFKPVAALAALYVQQGKINIAIDRVNKVIAKNPGNVAAITLLGKLYIKNKETLKAEETLKKSIKTNPKRSSPYYNLSSYYIAFKHTDKAIATLKEGIKLSNKSAGLKFMLATIYHRENKHTEAIKYYEELLVINPKQMAVTNNLALLLSNDKSKIDRALKLVAKLEETKNPYLLDTVGWVKYKAGQLDKAILILEQAAKKLPKVGEVNYHLGMAYYKKKNISQAKKYLELAVNSKQQFNGIEEAKTTLAKLSN